MPVGAGQERAQATRSPSPSDDRVGADRQGAARPQLGEERPLDVDRLPGRPVLDRGEQARAAASSLAALDRQGALADLGHHHVDGISSTGVAAATSSRRSSTLQRGRRHHDGAAVGHLAEPGVRCCPAARRTRGRVAAPPSWARRRTDPVATVAPGASSSSARPTSASRGSPPLGDRRRSPGPAVGVEGRSLAECTARSARPSSTACCTSFTNTPWPPMRVERARRVRRSPVVSTSDELDLEAGVGGLRAARRRARPASGPARCPGGDPQAARPAGVTAGRTGRAGRSALRSPRGVPRRPSAAPRLVQQLGHDGLG